MLGCTHLLIWMLCGSSFAFSTVSCVFLDPPSRYVRLCSVPLF
jgi:hypothetical protein